MFCVCVSVSACVPVCRSLWPHDLKSGSVPACFWVCGFESRRGHGFLSLVSVVCCQVEVSAAVRSLVQGRLTKCDASECDRKALLVRRPWPTRGCYVIGLGGVLCVEHRHFHVFCSRIEAVQYFMVFFNT
jgi:hypothetical protein